MIDHDFMGRLRMKMREANLGEYGDERGTIAWIDEQGAGEAERRRDAILAPIRERLNWLFSETKPSTGTLSPGCRICGEGSWSCLFINGKCNCRCFYCPAPQDDISIPTTNRLTFGKSLEYSDYVSRFGFEGVSISGGEPLLTVEKTLRYITDVRRKCGDDLHIWLYTNGALLTPDIVKRLRDAGLDEIRFDLSARNYDLTALNMAVGHIPVVTVEIPAVPEDLDTLTRLIPVLHESGVNHLNLHHLRLTPHNIKHLKNRGYTFLHGEKVTVLESELTALTLLERGCENGWKLSINYCAFAYKNQHQKAATRKRNASFIMKPHESVTANGYIRSLGVEGAQERIGAIAQRLSVVDPEKTQWAINGGREQILFHPTLWGHVDKTGVVVKVAYDEAILSQALSYYNPFREIRLDSGKKIYVERQNRKRIEVDDPNRYETSVFVEMQPEPDEEYSLYEFITPGLQAYF
jgi:pyruvate formate-lyase activating enzyme-like uncharacterized protein